MAEDLPQKDLSEKLKDYRLAKRKEKLATVGGILGGIGDVATGGAVGRAVSAWGPRKDRPLTLREKINAELKSAEKSQAQSAMQKDTVEYHRKAAIEARDQLEVAKARRTQIPLKESEAKIQEKWRNRLAPIREAKPPKDRIPSTTLDAILKDIEDLPSMTAMQMLDAIDPDLRADLNGEGNNSLATGKTINRFQAKFARANEDRNELEVQIQALEERKSRHEDRMEQAEVGELVPVGEGISGIQTGVATGDQMPSAKQYAAVGPQSVARIRALYNEIPDLRKDSQKQYEALAADEEMKQIARELGVTPENSIQMEHFIKTMSKAEKKARKLYARARKKGWSEEKLAEEMRASNIYSDPDGMMLSTKQMKSAMMYRLLGVEDPNYLAFAMEDASKDITDEERSEVEEVLKSEYEEEFDQDKADIEEAQAIQPALEAWIASGNDPKDATMENLKEFQAQRDAELDSAVASAQEDADYWVSIGGDPKDFTPEKVEAARSARPQPTETSFGFGETRLGDRLGETFSAKQKTDMELAEEAALDEADVNASRGKKKENRAAQGI